MLLTSFAFSNQFCRVFEHCGPVIPLSQCFPRQGSSSDVVSTYALVYLPEYVVVVFLPYTLKNGRREASFIKGPPMNGESYRPRFEFGRLLWVSWQCTVHQVIPDGVHSARFGHTGETSPLSMLIEGSGR